MKKHNFKSMTAAFIAAVLLASSMIPMPVQAASSASIKEEIKALEEERNKLQDQMSAVETQKAENWESIEEKIAYKNSIDEQIFLLYSEVDNLNSQIASYSQLISDTQIELDAAQQRLDELEEKNKERVRAMEEEGTISYWSVLFQANSFTDLIDRLNMIDEIQEADVRRMAELTEAAQQVEQVKQTLSEDKAALEASMQELEATQAELDEKRAETDAILAELNADNEEYQALLEEYHDEKDALVAEIAAAEVEYTKALAAEEEARRKAEEEARKRAEEEAKKNNNSNNNNNNNNSGNNSNGSTPPASSGSWLQPCSYRRISSSYGYRSSGWHNGVDFAAPSGTPIYATRSGTVTKAKSMTTSYGNHVVINHGDGYSSLYAHMTYFVVSAGEYVNRGQLIGYVGSTGNSTGPHLHFTVFYNGSTINPMSVL